ncbi:MAG: MaoC/PaaZ C-terminal domain-containing protein [Polymorphobacter sp.]
MTVVSRRLAELVRTVSARDVVMGAAATRDWQPQHHDADHARAMNLPGVIMNTPTQTGWFHAYAVHCLGNTARVGRYRLTMLRPVYPGLTLTMSGAVVGCEPCGLSNRDWVWLDLAMHAGHGTLSTMLLLLIRSSKGADSCGLENGSPTAWPPLDR